jgi:hypothetical protein
MYPNSELTKPPPTIVTFILTLWDELIHGAFSELHTDMREDNHVASLAWEKQTMF